MTLRYVEVRGTNSVRSGPCHRAQQGPQCRSLVGFDGHLCTVRYYNRCVQTGCGAYLACYVVGAMGPSAGSKVAMT